MEAVETKPFLRGNAEAEAVRLDTSDLLGGPASEVDERGLPRRFRVLGYGPGTLTIEGQTQAFEFLPEHAAAIVAHQQQKGEAIPVDCEHALYLLAREQGTEEDALARDPLLGERAACGYVRLAAADDGLWAEVESWVPRAALLLREKMYRYFSPVLRGLRDGRLRLTSLALTNQPALDGLAPLTAAPTADDAGRQRLQEELRRLLTVAGAASDTVAGPELIAALATVRRELQELRAVARGWQEFVAQVQQPLGLADRPEPGVLTGLVLALQERATQDAAALSAAQVELTELHERQDAEERRRLVEQGLASGQLTPALVEQWAGRQDATQLRAFLEHAAVVVPRERLPRRVYAGAAPGGAVEAITRACGQDVGKVSAVHAARLRQ